MNGLAARAHPFETAGPSARTVADGSMSPLAVARPSERLAIDQAEIAGIAWCGDIAEPSHEAIKEIRGRPLEPAFALTRGALGGDDVVALLPFGVEAFKQDRDDGLLVEHRRHEGIGRRHDFRGPLGSRSPDTR